MRVALRFRHRVAGFLREHGSPEVWARRSALFYGSERYARAVVCLSEMYVCVIGCGWWEGRRPLRKLAQILPGHWLSGIRALSACLQVCFTSKHQDQLGCIANEPTGLIHAVSFTADESCNSSVPDQDRCRTSGFEATCRQSTGLGQSCTQASCHTRVQFMRAT